MIGPELEFGDTLRLGMHAPELYRGDTAARWPTPRGWLADGWRAVFVTEGHGPASRMVESSAARHRRRLDTGLAELTPSVVHVATGSVEHGFVDPALKLAVLTETDLTGQKSSTKDMGRMPSRRRKTIDPLTLTSGDYIVHEQHGVGRYVEMVQRTVQGATREYLVVEYAPAKRGQPGDRLFVPTDQLEQVTKYVGGEAPSLTGWRRGLDEDQGAGEEGGQGDRRRPDPAVLGPDGAPGTVSPRHPWQRELEDAFPYVETPDQLTTIAEVKEDMEKSVPMDRLVCGDVGYGKTEIAVRAAFKAVQDGKQVACWSDDAAGAAALRHVLRAVRAVPGERAGAVAVPDRPRRRRCWRAAGRLGRRVIGTPAVLVGDQVQGSGLVIVDEEQRFGVEHKEQLKKLRANVDVLTMRRRRFRAPWRWR